LSTNSQKITKNVISLKTKDSENNK